MPVIDEDSVRRPDNGSIPLLHARAWNQDLYVHALRSVYHSHRVWEPSYADSREPDLYEKVRRDPVIAHAIEHRIHAVAGRRWHIEPGDEDQASKTLAHVVEEIMEQIEGFSRTRYQLAQAVITSRAYCYIESRKRYADYGGLQAKWWVPTTLQHIDRRRVRWVPVWSNQPNIHHPDRSGRLGTKLQMFSLEKGDWLDLVHPEWFVRHTYGEEEARLGYGRGILEAIYFYYFAKSVVLKQGLQGLEKWAQGMVTAKIDGLRAASTGTTNEDLLADWLDVLDKSRARHVVAHDKHDEIEVIEARGTGHQMVTDFLRYLDEAITMLVTGSIRPTGGGSGGSYARTSEEAESSEMLVQYDRTLLDETITRDLIGAILRHNRVLLRQKLPGAKPPKFRAMQEKREDPEVAANVAATLLGQGVPLRKDELYERAGFSPPKEEDDVFVPPAAAGGFASPPGMPDLGDDLSPETDDAPEPETAPTPQDSALAAGQITAATDVVAKVSAGEIPRDAGMGLLRAAYRLSDEQARVIMGSAGTGAVSTPDKTPAGSPVTPAPSESTDPQGGGNGTPPPTPEKKPEPEAAGAKEE